VREHIWFDPAEANGNGSAPAKAPRKAAAKKAAGS
jgi:hypothetical protein